MEYTWKITQLTKTNSGDIDNIIVGTRWEVTGTDEDGFSGTFIGATPFTLNTVDPDNFTPYEALTESQVLGWIQNVASGSASTSYWSHISERINKAIETEKNIRVSVDSNDLPWSPVSGSNETPPLPV
jgi:hypothetical protein